MPRRSPRSRKPAGDPPRIPAKAKPRATPGSRRKASRKKAVRKATGARATALRPGAAPPRGGHTRRTRQSPVASARAKRQSPARKPESADAAPRPRGRFAPPDATRIAWMFTIFERTYPGARCALDFKNPLQLLIATILSAQCTDVRVNMVTPGLFARYPDAAAFAVAPQAELEQAVRSTGFYRNKAKAIRECCAVIVHKYGGLVPRTLEELTALPGVGRKTANVVLGNAFGIPGLVVDTHVSRLAYRLGLTREQDPVKIEFALMPLLPRNRWTLFSHWLILHGRAVCNARKPRCSICSLAPHCPRAGVTISA